MEPARSPLEQSHQRLKERFRAVTEIGMRLATELDVDALLELVLSEARRLTASDAGSLYLRAGSELAFKLAQNVSHPEQAEAVSGFRLPIDKGSLAGLAALTKTTQNISDVQRHPSYDRDVAEKVGYAVHTMLVVPMLDRKDEVHGVLQLMNAKDASGRSVAYDDETAYLAEVLACHAATALSMAQLHARVHELLEAMVRYTTRAIDARDPATAGHSGRVASYALKLGELNGGFSKAQLRELKYAGLFHDLGKIGVPEAILTKRNKLSDAGLETLAERFEAAKRSIEAQALSAAAGGEAAAEAWRALDEDLAFIEEVNVPRPLRPGEAERLDRIAGTAFKDTRGRARPLLTQAEHEALSVPQGNLTEAERDLMRGHVEMGRSILRRFPFTDDLARIPEYVSMHHEKYDGTGYPAGIKGEAIPLGARILAVADAFDALTASDRPYKKPIPVERSLDILTHEAAHGHWDPRVVELLRSAVAKGVIKVRAVDDAV